MEEKLESPFKQVVEVVFTLRVPREKVDEVSQALVDLAGHLGVYEGGKLTQSDVKLD